MFIELNDTLKTIVNTPGVADPVFELHPLQLSGYLEAAWEVWRKLGEGSLDLVNKPAATAARAAVPALGIVDEPFSDVQRGDPLNIAGAVDAALRARDPNLWVDGRRIPLEVNRAVRETLQRLLNPRGQQGAIASVPWSHLMYAYLIENTRVYEIFERVLQGALFDESLGTLSDVSLRFLRTTEDLFFRDGNSSLVASITSRLRPDDRAIRRNAYQRMFGIDLNHGAADGGAYSYPRAAVANSDFVRVLQELLRELWRAFINVRNSSGPNTTDAEAIKELISKLRIMMNERRLTENGRANLAREEFVAVSTMGWFHLAVASDTEIVDDLRARSDQPEDRLRKLGERVNLPAHGKARSFFFLARDLPPLLREIEESFWDAPASNVALLFDPGLANSFASRTVQIINHWSLATGVDLKSVPVAAGLR